MLSFASYSFIFHLFANIIAEVLQLLLLHHSNFIDFRFISVKVFKIHRKTGCCSFLQRSFYIPSKQNLVQLWTITSDSYSVFSLSCYRLLYQVKLLKANESNAKWLPWMKCRRAEKKSEEKCAGNERGNVFRSTCHHPIRMEHTEWHWLWEEIANDFFLF